MATPVTPIYRLIQPSDLPAVFELETVSFPADEAATLESLTYRQSVASSLFLGAFDPTSSSPSLLAFACSTLTPSPTLTHDSMSTHVPSSPYIALHSLCVSPTQRRKGLASKLMKEYLRRAKSGEMGEVKGIRLISHKELIGLYEGCGFVNKGESEVVHGKDKWYELAVDFEGAATSAAGEVEVVQKVDESREPPNTRSPGYSFGYMEKRAVSAGGGGGWKSELVNAEDNTNSKALYCPRDECRSLILRKGVAKFVVSGKAKEDVVLPPLPVPTTSTTATPSSSSTTPPKAYWSLPSPLAFENIGFTRNVPPSSSPSPSGTIKYLTCADCDFGPLGWHDTEGRDLGMEVERENEGEGGEGEKGEEVRKGREFLLDVERVRYL